MNIKEKVLARVQELHGQTVKERHINIDLGNGYTLETVNGGITWEIDHMPHLTMGLSFKGFSLFGDQSDKDWFVWGFAAKILGISPWISVDDSLPELGQVVLSFGEQGIKQTTFTTYQEGSAGHQKGMKDTWFEFVNLASGMNQHWKVTHWMPMIETPKPNEV